jgi:hypothetical protein
MAQIEDLMVDVREDWLVKILIARTLRDEVLKRLFHMNVHPLSLFPGIGGLGRFCELKSELWGWE